MINFFSKYKFIFHLANIFLIILYIYPGSILGYVIYSDLQTQPQITRDFIVSTNHVYAFFLISLLGLLTFKKTNKLNILILYLLILSIVLEILHVFIPNRSFEFADLFGNLVGVFVLIIIQLLIHKNENFKN